MSKRLAYTQSQSEQSLLHDRTMHRLKVLKANLNPINYRLIYESNIGDKPKLVNAIDDLVQSDNSLTDMTAIRLTQQHITAHEIEEEQSHIAFHQQVVYAFEEISKRLDEQSELIKELSKSPEDLRFYLSKLTRSNALLSKKTKSTLTNVMALRAKSISDKEVTYTDLVTGLKNELHMQQMLPELIRQKGDKKALLALFDIDNFDLFNQINGHHLADSLLRSAAKYFDAFRQNGKGFSWRIGADEFLIVIVTDKADESVALLKAVHDKMNRLQFKEKNIADIRMSMSVIESSDDFIESINRVYRALEVIKNTAGVAIHVGE